MLHGTGNSEVTSRLLHLCRRLPLFAGIAYDTLESLLDLIHPRYSRVRSGASVLIQNDPYESLHVLLEGRCYAEMIDARGKVLRLEEFDAPWIFAPAVLFADRNGMPGSVIAASDCEIAVLSKDDLLRLFDESIQVTSNYLTAVSNRFTFLSRRISFLSFHTIREKVEYFVDNLQIEKDGWRRLPSSIEKLAEYFGVSRPSLSRVFLELEREGRLSRRGRLVKLNEDGT